MACAWLIDVWTQPASTPSPRTAEFSQTAGLSSVYIVRMSRPLRLEFPNALYHVTARGNHRQPIYCNDEDRRMWLAFLRQSCARYDAVVYAYCQMTNHYHLLVETRQANLQRIMHHLNARYAQAHNLRHASVGHLLQGRYKAILVQRDEYLLELARYIVLNPVRAGAVARPEDWPWSSYHWMFRQDGHPPWLDIVPILAYFNNANGKACDKYAQFVMAGIGANSPLNEAEHPIILGDPAFIAEHCGGISQRADEIARAQRRLAVRSLVEFERDYVRDEAMARAYLSTAYSVREISQHFGVSSKTVSRAAKRYTLN